MNKRNGFAPLLILLVIAGVLVVGGAWYYEAHKGVSAQAPNISLSQNQSGQTPTQNTGNQPASPSAIINPALTSSATPTSTWKTYSHVANPASPYDMNFSFLYPPDYTVQMATSTANGMGVSIKGPKVANWFQPLTQLSTWSDPPTHIYENALNGGWAVDFATDSGNAGVETVPGTIMFDTGKKDSGGNKIILQLGSAYVDSGKDVGYDALTEKIAKTLTFSQVLPSSTTSQGSSLNFTINGSTGPLTLAEGGNMSVVWSSTGVSNCTLNGHSVLSASKQLWGGELPGIPATSTTYVLSCKGTDGSTLAKSIQVSWAPLTASLTIDSSVQDPISVGARSQNILLTSYTMTASGPDGILLSSINIIASTDVALGKLSLANVKVKVTAGENSAWFTLPPNFTLRGGPYANDFFGTFVIPQNSTAKIQIYGDTVSAALGTYATPFSVQSIMGGPAASPNTQTTMYSGYHNGSAAGQNIVVQ